VVLETEPALEVCWLGLDAVAEGELFRVFCPFCVFEVAGFPEPFGAVVVGGLAGFAGFAVLPPPVPWVPVVAGGAGVGFAGGFEVVVV